MSYLSATELEVKILDADIEGIQNRLHLIGAEYLGERFQEIYTYDIYPIHARIESLVKLDNRYGDEGGIDIAHSIQHVINELTYLLSFEDADNLNKICLRHNAGSWLEFQSHIAAYDYRSILDGASPVIRRYSRNDNKWARLRRTTTNDGMVSATIAVKEITQKVDSHNGGDYEIDNMKETEVGIDSFESGKLLLENFGYYFRNYQEKKRISYLVGDVCVDIDIWPVIPPYIEIEGKTKEAISSTLMKLGISTDSAKVISPETVFLKYGVDVLSKRILSFNKQNHDST